MELRFSTSGATKNIDLTCLHRTYDFNLSMEEIIIHELKQLAKLDLNDFFTDDFKKLFILCYAKSFEILKDLEISKELKEKVCILFNYLT